MAKDQKNFRQIPDAIERKLEKLKGRNVFVSCATKLSEKDIRDGVTVPSKFQFRTESLFFRNV